tara:strand:- start:190 stop:1086 length:897 start_codon:yes stop_codon:yes gene_type:complete
MPLLHIEHPEDMVLSGELSVLNWFTSKGHLSTKIDGSPALVWGTNPANNRFFVGTKSVFNKKLIKINYDHKDIDNNHKGKVADILHKFLDNITPTNVIYQGDFIGFGGNFDFCPNTISYDFPEEVHQEIVIAPHTYYIVEGDLKDAVAHPLQSNLESNNNVLFVQPKVTLDDNLGNIPERCKFAQQIATLCEFPNSKRVKRIKKQLNACIRERLEIDDITLEAIANDNECDINVLRLWKLVQAIKLDMFNSIQRYDEIECYIDGEECDHEGYVLVNEYGYYKIIDREYFSCANFNRVR